MAVDVMGPSFDRSSSTMVLKVQYRCVFVMCEERSQLATYVWNVIEYELQLCFSGVLHAHLFLGTVSCHPSRHQASPHPCHRQLPLRLHQPCLTGSPPFPQGYCCLSKFPTNTGLHGKRDPENSFTVLVATGVLPQWPSSRGCLQRKQFPVLGRGGVQRSCTAVWVLYDEDGHDWCPYKTDRTLHNTQ